jgi:hypothetical protein
VNPAADVFSFGASVTLQPNTQYFFYQNATSQVTAGQTYSGGNSYISFGSDQLFSSNSTSLNFSVTGSPAAPETSNLLVGLGVLGLVGFECLQRKRRKLAA